MNEQQFRNVPRRPSWYTFDDWPNLEKLRSLEAFDEALWSEIRKQPSHCGELCVGKISADVRRFFQHGRHQLNGWGRCWVCPVSSAYFYCRSTGPIGTPLLENELRHICLLIFSGNADARSVTMRLRLRGVLTAADISKYNDSTQMLVRNQAACAVVGRISIAPLGVPVLGVHLPEHPAADSRVGKEFAMGRDGFHVVHGSFVQHPDVAWKDPCEANVNQTGLGIHPIAASLLGYECEDAPARCCLQTNIKIGTMNGIRMEFLEHMAMMIQNDHPDWSRLELLGHALGAFCTAKSICEGMSFLGLLDRLANTFYMDSHPDDFLSPCGMTLFLCLAIRAACHPERLAVEEGTHNDHVARAQFTLLLEETTPPLHGTRGNGTAHYAVDLVLDSAIARMKTHLKNDSSGEDGIKERQLEDMQKALGALARAGLVVLIDLCGPADAAKDYTPDAVPRSHGGVGCRIARKCASPVLDMRAHRFWRQGLGKLSEEEASAPRRSTTRNARLGVLMDIFVFVEGWLRTGLYNGAEYTKDTNRRTGSVPVGKRVGDEQVGASPASQAAAPVPKSSKKKARQATRKSPEMIDKLNNVPLNPRAHGHATCQMLVILQHGLQYACTEVLGMTEFLVSGRNVLPCATCPNGISIIAAVAMSCPNKSKCTKCSRHICVSCQDKIVRNAPVVCPACGKD